MSDFYSSLGLTEEDLNLLYSNPDFTFLLDTIEESNSRFASLPTDQKKLALALVLQGNIDYVEGLWKLFYKRRIPTIQEFVTSKYIGSNASFYPIDSKWREDFETVFNDSSSIYEWICTGAIGTGKTTAAITGHFYNLFRVTSLRYPQLAMGSGETKPLALMLLTITKEKAHDMMEGMRVLLKNCKYFEQVTGPRDFDLYTNYEFCDVVPYYETKVEGFPRIMFPNNVYIGSGSQLSHTIGSDIFGVILDEAEFRGNTANKAFELYSELLSRVISRFLKTKFKMVSLVSSVKHETGIMATHIKELQSEPNNPYYYISSYAIWEIKPDLLDAFEKYGSFWVFRGTKSHPSRVLNDEERRLADSGQFFVPENCKLIKVPAEPNLILRFKTNVERALMEQAGEYTSGGERPFDDLSSIEDSVLTAEMELTAPLEGVDPDSGVLSMFEQLPKHMFVKTPDGLRLRRYPNAKRYIHLDLAESGEGGICMLHKEIHPITGHVIYIIDIIAKITSYNKISFQMIEDFLCDIKNIGNVFIQKLTADQYQSTSMLQKMDTLNVAREVTKQAMGTKPPPFRDSSTLIGEGSVKCGSCPMLKEQMKGVYFYNEKVEYETDRKDMVDALVGALYAAKWYTLDVPVNLYLSEQSTDEFRDLNEALKGLRKLK